MAGRSTSRSAKRAVQRRCALGTALGLSLLTVRGWWPVRPVRCLAARRGTAFVPAALLRRPPAAASLRRLHAAGTRRGCAAAARCGCRCAAPHQAARSSHSEGAVAISRDGTSKAAESVVTSGPGEADLLSQLPTWVWRLVILVLCMLWATNFAVIKEITAQPGVTTQLYAVSRFTLAATIMAPFLLRVSSTRVLQQSVECGAWVALGYIGQAVGLMTTTAAKSCFICSLNVVFVSLVVGITTRRFDPQTSIAAVLAIIGVGFLELAGSQQFVIGDLISLAQPVGFGIGYIRLEQIMAESPGDASAVTAAKLLMVALASWSYFFLTTGMLPDFNLVLAAPPALAGVLWTGLVTSSLALLVESVAFRYIDASSASVIFTTEPLWAAIFAVWLISEPFSMADGFGGVLVILACVIKELPTSWLPWTDTHADGNEDSVPAISGAERERL